MLEIAVVFFGAITVWNWYDIHREQGATNNLAKYVVFLLDKAGYVRDGKLVLTEAVVDKQNDTKGKGPLGFVG